MSTISIVIPTVRGELIQETIAGLITNSLLPLEVIVVDQGGLLTQDFFKRFNSSVKFQLFKDTGKGAARARNIGWKAAKGSIVAFIDDDAIPSQIWLESIENSFKNNLQLVGVVGGKITPVYNEKNPVWMIPKEFEFMLPAYDQGEEEGEYNPGNLPASVNMAISKELLESTAGFNEKLGTSKGRKIQIFGEDTDLSMRIKALGLRLIYNPKAEVFHPVPLERQSEAFFKKRVLIEGYTMAFLDCKLKNFTLTNKIYIIYNEVRKQILLWKTLRLNKSVLIKGKLNYSKGYLRGILRFGFINKL
jgi:glucosyl-dolichyl phosphate glucuronosyltransferase